MTANKVCPECGSAMRPAMVRCMVCGARPALRKPASSSGVDTSATQSLAARTSPHSNSGVQVFGRSAPFRSMIPRAIPRKQHKTADRISAELTGKQLNLPDSHNGIESTGLQAGCHAQPQQPINDETADNKTDEQDRSRLAASSPSTFIFTCECGSRMRVPCDRAGRKKKCRRCSRIVVLDRQPACITPSEPDSTDESDLRIRLDVEVDRAIKRITTSQSESPLRKTLSSRRLKKLAESLIVANPLSRREAETRRKAVLELGESRDVRASGLISPLLSDDSETVRKAVATASGELGDRKSSELAVGLLLDRDPDVLREALTTVRRLKEPNAVRPLLVLGLDNPLLGIQASEAIVQMGEVAIADLLDVLGTQTDGMVSGAIVALGRIGSPRAVPALIDTLNVASGSIRGYAAEALGKIGVRDVIPNIIRLLNDRNQFVQLSAVTALRTMPDRKAVRPLLECLEHADNPELVRRIVLALGATKDPRAIPGISKLLSSADEPLRAAIAEAMGKFEDSAACETLLALLRTGSPELQLKAIVALRKVATEAAQDDLFELTGSSNSRIRRHAVEALAELAPPEAEDVFAELLLSDAVYEVRVAAAKGLGELGIPEASVTLEKALRDEAPVRCAAVMAMTRLGDRKVVPALIATLRDPAPEVRYHAVTGLGKLGANKSVTSIESILDDKDAMVRKGAEKALEELGVGRPTISVGRRLSSIAGNLIPDSLVGSIPFSAVTSVVILVVASVAGGAVFLIKESIANEPPHLILSRAEPVKQVSWLPGSKQVVLVRQSDRVEFWDVENGTFVKSGNDVRARSLWFNPAAQNLMLQSETGILAWNFDLNSAGPIAFGPPLPSEHTSITPAADCEACLVCMKAAPTQREYRIWAPQKQDATPVTFTLEPVPSPAISGDGKWVAGVVPKQGLMVFSAETGRPISVITVPDAAEHQKPVSLSMNGNGALLVALSGKELLTVDLENAGTPHAEWHQLDDPVSRLTFTPGGSAVCLVGSEKVGLLDVKTGNLESWSVSDKEIDLTTVSASPDTSRIVASGQDEKLAWLINTADGSVTELSPVAIPLEARRE